MNTIRIPARELRPGDRVLVGALNNHVQLVQNVFQSVSTWIRYADHDESVGDGPQHIIAPDEYLTIIADD